MTLDMTIKKILISINTERRMLYQALLDEEMSGPAIAKKIREFAGDKLAPTNSKAIQACKKLADIGALSMREDENRPNSRSPKYYFSTKDERYKALAALALRTAVTNSFSFHYIFKCSALPEQSASNSILYTYKVLSNFDSTETYSSLVEKTGIRNSRVWTAVDRLENAGLVDIDKGDQKHKYFKHKSLENIKGTKHIVKLAKEIEQFTPVNSTFTINDMYVVLGPKGYSKDAIRRCLDKLSGKYFTKTIAETDKIKLTSLGDSIVEDFIIPMDFLLTGKFDTDKIYQKAGQIDSETINRALAVYAKAERHLAASR